MKLTYTQPTGPWQTRMVYNGDQLVARIRKQPHVGYQVISNNIFWKGKFGQTNTRFFKQIRDAKRFCIDLAQNQVPEQ